MEYIFFGNHSSLPGRLERALNRRVVECPTLTQFCQAMVHVDPVNFCIFLEKEDVRIEDSLGRVGGEFVIPYPPGVAVLAPGEVIDQELIDFLVRAREMNIDINGMESHALDKIKVIK